MIGSKVPANWEPTHRQEGWPAPDGAVHTLYREHGRWYFAVNGVIRLTFPTNHAGNSAATVALYAGARKAAETYLRRAA